MKKKASGLFFALYSSHLLSPAQAQQPPKASRIGFLINSSASDPETALRADAFG
jgi:hypothetical protein